MNKKILISLSAFALLAGALAGCGGSKSETGKAVAKASKMTLAELEEASKKEAEAAGDEFKLKVVGLTSVLHTVAESVAEKYEWFNYTYDKDAKKGTGNIDVNNGYKDYALLSALNVASDTYFADYALAQDARSFSTFIDDEITFNYVPSDAKSALGMTDETLLPLHGVHFNKLFYTNTNFSKFHPKGLYNIWQVAGHDTVYEKDGVTVKTPVDHEDHLSKVSFQSPTTEQINMSFLVSCYAEENQARIEKAYEDYYGKKWEASGTYLNAGQQWVAEFIANVSKWHTSDGTAMKETQLSKAWGDDVVYYGAFAKMKDAAGNKFEIDLNGDGKIEKNVQIVCDGKTYTYDESKVCAMDTVKWDWAINGFNGFMYCMDSQIINNAKYPYSACLFARTLLEQEVYEKAIYNSKNPGEDGKAANQYGYYYPGQASDTFRYAKGDWTKAQHMEKEINENYEYLKNVKISTVNNILGLVNSNTKSAS